MIGIEQQIISVASWLLLLKFLQLSCYPALKRTFGGLAYPLAFGTGLLLFTALSWYAGLAHLPLQAAVIPFVAVFVWHLRCGEYRRSRLRGLLVWDLIFASVFIAILGFRFVNPTISFAEKFMDHAFIAAVINNPVVPPIDPWFLGGSLDMYYYLGFWMAGAAGLATNLPSQIVFNLMIPTVISISAVTIYALGDLLLARFRWLLLVPLFIFNPSLIYHLCIGTGFYTALWESTRTITYTINEYPLFSTVWGDPHPHVIGIFVQILLIAVLVFAYERWDDLDRRGRLTVCLLGALALGSMPPINTWDVMVYAPVTVLFASMIWMRYRRRDNLEPGDAWMPFLLIPALGVLLYAPYYLMLSSRGVGGIGLVHTPTDPFQFILVHGIFLAVLYLYCARDIIRRPLFLAIPLLFAMIGQPSAAIALVPLIYLAARKRYASQDILAIAGLVIITATELVYLKDNMGEIYYRMNTIFKFYLPAWILLGTSSALIVGARLSERYPGGLLPRKKGYAAAAVIVAMLMLSPWVMGIDFGYGSRTLDGVAYLDGTHPGDAAAVAYLRSLGGDIGIVEAEGGDYTYYSRISSFTGIPSIIGMPFHEVMWRGSDAGVGERMGDVQKIYEEPRSTVALMEHYGADLLYVGEAERERYRVSIPGEGLELIYDHDGVQIYRLAG